ncbi:hypothetical protein BW14_06995 [Bifidobacterium sp. UTBIF-68]|uniref:hypothetical protein n=1 Tax=Bifidobacterium sp. UTBIF-68 TaxID=1465262 RepID=UPI001127FB55|nr:hypothetical protein [Bifidobacterium sp. UTBIF-68]TPF92903.1 hypothetical protein BW14_06995 [Bifidobacterium sp. UTBIF-68]
MELKATVNVPVNPRPSSLPPELAPKWGSKAGILTLDIPTLTDGHISESFTDITPMTEMWNTGRLIDAFNKAAEAFDQVLNSELTRQEE